MKKKLVGNMILKLDFFWIIFAFHLASAWRDDWADDDTDISDYNFKMRAHDSDSSREWLKNIGIRTNSGDQDDCWMTLNAEGLFNAMDELDRQYAEVKRAYQENVGDEMDGQLLDEFLQNRGAAYRTIHKAGGHARTIPTGLNLGGHCMMRMKDSILFFHRMKLRNSTIFRVDYLHNDLENMALVARLNLNDLHLIGAYERSATHEDPSILYYRPSYGQIELLLRNVTYNVEARLRLMSKRFTIELINSEMVINDDILMTYVADNNTGIPVITALDKRNIDDFLQRLKTDLDLWLKDYFNDFFMYYQLPDYDHLKFQEYENKRTILLNDYVAYALNTIKQKIYNLNGQALSLPRFTIFSVPNLILRIKDGVLDGLHSIYRRSVATGRLSNKMRLVDVIIGWSKLKVEYKFEAVLPNGSPPITGSLLLLADETTAHLGIALVKNPESVDLNFDFIQQLKPGLLTVEGSANRMIANFKHQLESQILSIMSNGIMHNIKMLNTITRCAPYIYGRVNNDTADKDYLRNGSKSKLKLQKSINKISASKLKLNKKNIGINQPK